MTHPNVYGDKELARVLVNQILEEVDLSDEDYDIFILRFGQDWYLSEIGEFVGEKYRQKPYSEGAIRHRIRRIMEKLEEVIANLS